MIVQEATPLAQDKNTIAGQNGSGFGLDHLAILDPPLRNAAGNVDPRAAVGQNVDIDDQGIHGVCSID